MKILEGPVLFLYKKNRGSDYGYIQHWTTLVLEVLEKVFPIIGTSNDGANVLSPTGNVGIGTMTNPEATLDVLRGTAKWTAMFKEQKNISFQPFY